HPLCQSTAPTPLEGYLQPPTYHPETRPSIAHKDLRHGGKTNVKPDYFIILCLDKAVEYEKRKKAEGRMVRAYRQQVMDMLFSAFEEHQYYNIKDLLEVAKQPATYLKEILREIGVYNTKGTHKSTWELKPKYHHYQGKKLQLCNK
uniref:General transcription factor IIF subunit 2 n=1 Tax=Oncorhynchus kisutch TaxID=8019 RepID=A0A8C7I5F8_ONCKI